MINVGDLWVRPWNILYLIGSDGIQMKRGCLTSAWFTSRLVAKFNIWYNLAEIWSGIQSCWADIYGYVQYLNQY